MDLSGLVPPANETRTSWEDGWLAKMHRKRVVHNDNDFLVAVAASSKSAVSGVGKTTLGIRLCRHFDVTDGGWSADKATLDAGEFVNNLMTDTERVPDGSAVLFDEMQGTLDGDGADSRRSMASSVVDVSRAIATLRYRQLSGVLITQSTQWIDSRVRELLDALILIQEPGRARVFDVYRNDLATNSTEYTEGRDTLKWSPLPEDDEDYVELHRLKAKSSNRNSAESEEDDGAALSDKAQIMMAEKLRQEADMSWQAIADQEGFERSREWYRQHCDVASVVN